MWRVLLSFGFLVVVIGDPVVEGDLGRIRGKILGVLDEDIEAFLGIPYAKPPVGDLRFALPEAFGSVGDLDAIEDGPSCPQLHPWPEVSDHGVFEEDCLNLNVFRRRGTSKSDKKAVSMTLKIRIC